MHIESALKRSGLRATPHRMALLGTLATATSPKTAEEIHSRMEGIDLVTIYRNLQSLVASSLVREVRFKDTATRFELAVEGGHHHHIVCVTCGTIAELDNCATLSLEKKALAQTTSFVSIQEHALEFFGTCRACAAK